MTILIRMKVILNMEIYHHSILNFYPLISLDFLATLLLYFKKAIYSISSGHFIPRVSGQKLADPNEIIPRTVNKMK